MFHILEQLVTSFQREPSLWKEITTSVVLLVRWGAMANAGYQPYHPLRSDLPCNKGAADLEPVRLQIWFSETGQRFVIRDTWDSPVMKDRSMHWTGFTLFKLKVLQQPERSQGFPNVPVGSATIPGDQDGRLWSTGWWWWWWCSSDGWFTSPSGGAGLSWRRRRASLQSWGMPFGVNSQQSYTVEPSRTTRSSTTTEASAGGAFTQGVLPEQRDWLQCWPIHSLHLESVAWSTELLSEQFLPFISPLNMDDSGWFWMMFVVSQSRKPAEQANWG